MPSNRRTFLTGGATALAAGSLGAAILKTYGGDAATRADGPQCLDYGWSFICNSAAFNAVRFWVESCTTLIDENGTATEFYQCGSCKSENTFGEKDLFYKDNYDFLPILGGGDWLIFRRPCRLSETYRQVRKAEEIWGEPILKLRPARHLTVLDSWESIRDATAAGLPIVSQTEIRHADSGLRAIIECPVKTMNISLDRKMYQVDTGPVAFPDLTRRYERPSECLSLAFVAFNAPHFADFVIEQPTVVVENAREVCRVYHYSNPFSLPATNRMLALADTV
jgi:hypothetical protein